MRKALLSLLFAFCGALYCAGQTPVPADSLAVQDSLSLLPQIDSTYLGKAIFDVLPDGSVPGTGKVTVNQSREIRQALDGRIAANSIKKVQGYRIRIYFSSAQNARNESAAAAVRFRSGWNYPVYRSFESPNFKVTVGNFRTKSEALSILEAVRCEFPSAFIVREEIDHTF